ncbi:hypothetical protein, partial [Scytonema sp. PCC 10023]|uniref:hypothetical protein n=1 Tax=Scytonema sp. PCC 10023 TaxID=1680591 RepID=UPI0039C64B77
MLDFKYVTKGRKTFGTGSRWNDYERLPKGHWRSQSLYYISDASVIPLSIRHLRKMPIPLYSWLSTGD